MTNEELFNWCCKQNCKGNFNCDLCMYDKGRADATKELPTSLYCDGFNDGYPKGRADAIDECIKLVGGNIKTITGVVFDNSIPIHDRALGRMAKNKLIEELVEQLEQLKEQNK